MESTGNAPANKNDEPKKPFPDFSIQVKVMQYGWNRSGRFAMYFCALIVFSILVPYSISLAGGNLKPILPALSHAGTDSLRSGLASVGMFLTALVGSAMISVRYVHVASLNESRDWKLKLMNKLALAVGFVSFSGLVILASFPVTIETSQLALMETSGYHAHMVGAFLAFFFGAVYLLMHTAISLFYYESNKVIVWVRVILCLACAVLFVTSSVSTLPKPHKPIESGNFHTGVLATLVNEPNLLASICEWFLVLIYAMFFLTFVKEGELISAALTFRHVTTGGRISFASPPNMSKI